MLSGHEGESPPRAGRQRLAVVLVVVVLLAAGALLVLRVTLPDRAARLQGMDTEALRAAARARPNDAAVFLALGKRLRQSGDRHGGFVMTNRAYDLSAGEAAYIAAMAGALMDEADYNSAHRLLTDGGTRWPAAGEIHAEYSRFYAEQGRFTDALREAEMAVSQAPRLAESWQSLGRARAENKRPDAAFEAFEHALRLEPRDAELMTDYGEALARFGRTTQAEALLRQAVTLAPRAARPAARLGRLLA